MKKKIQIYLLVVGLIVAGSSYIYRSYFSSNANDGSVELTALKLSIENVMKVKDFGVGTSDDFVKVKFVVIPITKQLIDVTVRYHAKLNKMDAGVVDSFIEKANKKYIDGTFSSFAIFIIRTTGGSGGRAYFSSKLDESVVLDDDFKNYNITGYTKNLNIPFNVGVNSAYIHFDNFRKENPYSYSLTFSNFAIGVYPYISDYLHTYQWSFSFDNTELGMLALLKNGLTEEQVRENYGVYSYSRFSMSESDFLTILNTIVTLIGIA